MGGVGAHFEDDFKTLRSFIEEPWLCPETQTVYCREVHFSRSDDHHPVHLVIFDFDETLTLATFMPKDQASYQDINWRPDPTNVQELVQYNFETPFPVINQKEGSTKVHSRCAKLRGLFENIAHGKDNEDGRILAILTKNEQGVLGVLNLLKLANLDQYFSAIWTIPSREDRPNGVCQVGKKWETFNPPTGRVNDHKVEVVYDICEQPQKWFPQMTTLKSDDPNADTTGWSKYEKTLHRLTRMRNKYESVVLVDDERANFKSDAENSDKCMLRYCKVARYDADYRDCGALNQLGGIGAHSDDDYRSIKDFVRNPWHYSQVTDQTVSDVELNKSDREGDDALGELTRQLHSDIDNEEFTSKGQKACNIAKIASPTANQKMDRLVDLVV
jgi:hypothetical protein